MIVFAILLNLDSVWAQNTESLYECIYQYTVSSVDKHNDPFSDVGYCMLQIGRGLGKFYDYSSFQTDSVTQANSTSQVIDSYKVRERKNMFFFDQTVYQNTPKGKMTVQSVITPNTYNYEEDRFPIQWTMKEEIDTVCGYTCRIAEGQYGGRTWIVKYAPEIPTQNGPWKLAGLPGLILDAADSEGIHHFTAVAFRNGSVGISPLDNQGRITTNRAKFIQAKNRFEENPIGNLPPEAIGEMVVMKDGENPSIIINGVQLRMRPHPYIPLEIE